MYLFKWKLNYAALLLFAFLAGGTLHNAYPIAPNTMAVNPDVVINKLGEEFKNRANRQPFSYFIGELLKVLVQHADHFKVKYKDPKGIDKLLVDLKKIQYCKDVLTLVKTLLIHRKFLPEPLKAISLFELRDILLYRLSLP